MKVKVLIVDDAATVRTTAKYILKQSFPHIIVEEAVNGNEAKLNLEQFHYDLVISDWEMPEMCGDELLIWMKNSPKLRDIPFIMISAKNDSASVRRAIELGASSFIVKPYSAELLTQRIVAVVNGFDRRASERFHVNGAVTIQSNTGPISGKITEISMGGFQGVFSGKHLKLPILEAVELDIKLEGSFTLEGIEGFIVRTQAEGDSTEIKIAFKHIIPPEKQDKLNDFLKNLHQ